MRNTAGGAYENPDPLLVASEDATEGREIRAEVVRHWELSLLLELPGDSGTSQWRLRVVGAVIYPDGLEM